MSGPSFSGRCKHISKSQHLKFKIERNRSNCETDLAQLGNPPSPKGGARPAGKRKLTVCFHEGYCFPTEKTKVNYLELLAEKSTQNSGFCLEAAYCPHRSTSKWPKLRDPPGLYPTAEGHKEGSWIHIQGAL